MHVESDSPGGRTGPMAMFDVYDCLVCLSVAIYSSFLPARRYASAGVLLAMALCLCLSQVGVLSKRLKKIGLVFDMGASLCYKEIQVPSKIRALPSGTLLQTLDL